MPDDEAFATLDRLSVEAATPARALGRELAAKRDRRSATNSVARRCVRSRSDVTVENDT